MLPETLSIKVTPTAHSRIGEVDFDNLPFGRIFSDHMLVMDYKDGEWQQPEIMAFGNLSLHPATSAIHYGQSIFEGMKANKTEDGEILIFRPEMNAHRFKESCERMCMPTIPEEVLSGAGYLPDSVASEGQEVVLNEMDEIDMDYYDEIKFK